MKGMLYGKDRIISTMRKVLRSSTADETEVFYLGETSGLTRFAGSAVHQNVEVSGGLVGLRVVLDGRVGRAFTSGLSPEDIFYTLVRATEMARSSLPLKDFPGLPGKAGYRRPKGLFERTADMTPALKARMLREAFGRAGNRFPLFGSFNTRVFETAVVNTKGLAAYHPRSIASFKVIARCGDLSGYAAAITPDAGTLDLDALVDTAAGKCRAGSRKVEIEPGRHDCILEPEAVADLLLCMADSSFGSRSFEDGESFLCGGIGRRLTGRLFTVFDDPTGEEEGSVPRPFDCEGVPARKVMIIERGKACGVVSDYFSARRLGIEPSGHAAPGDSIPGEGGFCSMLCMAAGNAQAGGMLGALGRGVWITKLNYVNCSASPGRAFMTGTTRNGTFLVEDGRISAHAADMRFADDVLEALSRLEIISAVRRLAGNDEELVLCPYVLVRGLRFIGER